MSLTSSQRKHLRGLAHKLEPLVNIGKEGLSGGVLKAIDKVLADHELIKIKLTDDREERKTMAPEIAERTKSDCAGVIGRIGIFYRPHAEPEKRKIRLS